MDEDTARVELGLELPLQPNWILLTCQVTVLLEKPDQRKATIVVRSVGGGGAGALGLELEGQGTTIGTLDGKGNRVVAVRSSSLASKGLVEVGVGLGLK
jgi:hypothetical protein